jgi:hypothetical protein
LARKTEIKHASVERLPLDFTCDMIRDRSLRLTVSI